MSIHVVEARRPNPQPDGFSSTTFDAVVDLVRDRGTEYRFVLDVQPADGEPYRVEVEEKVPKRAVSPGLSYEEKIPSGIDLTGWVRVGEPGDVRIDWTSYRATAASKAAVEGARQVEADEVYARGVLAKASPKQQEKLRAAAWTTVSSLATAAREGAITREEWENSAQTNLRRTLITPEQYDAAARMIDSP